ncbi:unnamed protein product, partial [Nesidiocoris tenuis]
MKYVGHARESSRARTSDPGINRDANVLNFPRPKESFPFFITFTLAMLHAGAGKRKGTATRVLKRPEQRKQTAGTDRHVASKTGNSCASFMGHLRSEKN